MRIRTLFVAGALVVLISSAASTAGGSELANRLIASLYEREAGPEGDAYWAREKKRAAEWRPSRIIQRARFWAVVIETAERIKYERRVRRARKRY